MYSLLHPEDWGKGPDPIGTEMGGGLSIDFKRVGANGSSLKAGGCEERTSGRSYKEEGKHKAGRSEPIK